MDTTTEHKNTRLEELEFLITIMSDLAHEYKDHNDKLLEELISNLKYRKNSEEATVVAKSKSVESNKQKHH